MRTDSENIVIIGGGPAGAAAAVVCARAGLAVSLISPAFPGKQSDRTESIHPGVAVLLDRLGLTAVWQKSARGTYDGIWTKGCMTSLNPYTEERWTGYHLSRTVFHEQLRKEIGQLPLTLIDGEVLRFERGHSGVALTLRSGDTINAGLAIDASGRKRLIGSRLELPERLCSPPMTSYHAETEGQTNFGASFEIVPDGWRWSITLDSGRQAVTGLLVGKEDKSSPRAHPGARYDNARWRRFENSAGPGFLLAGDAAGMLDPAAGQGILMALRSGIMAAETALQIAAGRPHTWELLRSYERWFTSTFDDNAAQLKERYELLGINTKNWPADRAGVSTFY
jgi:2-polyprenyl-6-methoxyphenol hydroxylase-like FAD-dependent oxidoreductase